MPDPWEYPWFAAWDLGFHAVAWAHLDPAFAKYQLLVLLREWFQHPNGALPAYEWNFDDVNPPVHVMAALRVYRIDGSRDREFLERVFQKLLVNFTWWLNRQDADGNNVFSGGFLGLDNISPLDRSNLPAGVKLEQADGTAWMAYYALSMLVIAIALAEENPVYEDMVIKFLEQFLQISQALSDQGLYDADGHVLLRPAGTALRTDRSRSRCARSPASSRSCRRWRCRWRTSYGSDGLRHRVATHPAEVAGPRGQSRRAGAPDGRPAERTGVHGGSRHPAGRPCGSSSTRPPSCRPTVCARCPSATRASPFTVAGMPGASIDYEPAESRTGMFGGNSNWRGPIWMPLNYLAIRQFGLAAAFFGDEVTVEYPTGSGTQATYAQVAQDLADRLLSIWLPGPDGRRPVYGGVTKLQEDPAWKDNLLFFEYFHATTVPASARCTRPGGRRWWST